MKRLSSPIEYLSTYQVSGPVALSEIATLVLQSRVEYSSKHLGFDLVKFTKAGKGFFVSRISVFTQTRDLSSYQSIQIRSHVESYVENEGTRLNIPFEVTSDGQRLFAGEVAFTFIDTRQGKPAPMDTDMWKYFSTELENGTPKLAPEPASPSAKPLDLEASGPSLQIEDDVKPEDIDFYKHVNTAVYIKYVEKMVASAGSHLDGIACRFKIPLKLGDKYQITIQRALRGTNGLARIGGTVNASQLVNAEFTGEIR